MQSNLASKLFSPASHVWEALLLLYAHLLSINVKPLAFNAA